MNTTTLVNFVHRPEWLRRFWLWTLKKSLGASLRLSLLPDRHRRVAGVIHDYLAGALSENHCYDFRREVDVEVSSICNAKCSFCPYPILEFPKKLLPNETFERTLDFAARLGIQSFDLTPYLGEALVDPHFLKRLSQLRARFPQAHIQFTTNGTLFTRCDCEELLKSGVNRINVSFGSWGKEDYLKLYRIDAWDAVLSGVQKILDTKRSLNSPVKIHLWYRALDSRKVQANPENQLFLKRYRDLIEETLYTDIFHDIPYISGQQPDYIKRTKLDTSAMKPTPCANLSKLGVSSTGNVFACYCATTDAFRQQDSWFFLGALSADFDPNAALAAKAAAWERGEMPECCKSCPIYLPTRKSADIRYQKISLPPDRAASTPPPEGQPFL
ncbi:MAG: radical SAM protein [Verrucomicrobia bacterium]|nr:MAG: radical SAM protein [Verrucomicrobiota bacterium]